METTWETQALDGRIILRWIFRKWDVGGMDWIELAQDRDKWWALVNVRSLYRAGSLTVAERELAR